MRKIKKLLCRWFPRYKLHCILRALELDARPWQINFALGRSNLMPVGRCTGKTIAIMLRALMQDPRKTPSLERVIRMDPDYKPDHLSRVFFFRQTYDTYCMLCTQAGIPVPVTLFRQAGAGALLWATGETTP